MRGSGVTAARSCLQPLVSASRYLAVHGLPGDSLYFVVEAKSRVKEVYAQTCSLLGKQGMRDCELFGLAILSDGEYLFVDPESKLSKYAPKNWRSSHTYGLDSSGRPAFVLYFRVRYYVDTPLLLSDETTRHHYYLQLRDNVVRHGGGVESLHPHHPLHRPEIVSPLLALAGLALQADLGDYSEERHRPHAGSVGYCKPSDYLPPHMCLEANIVTILGSQHRDNRGLSREEAELQYIREAVLLEAPLNAHLYRLRRTKSEAGPGRILLAICARGVRVYTEEQIPRVFAWNNIGKLCFDRKKFEIRAVDHPDKLTLYSGCDDKSKLLLGLCRDTHQFSMAIAPRVTEARRREEEERKVLRDCYMYPSRCKLTMTTRSIREDQRISVISSTSSNTTSGIVSDRVHSEDEPDTAPASTECLARIAENTKASLVIAGDSQETCSRTSSPVSLTADEIDGNEISIMNAVNMITTTSTSVSTTQVAPLTVSAKVGANVNTTDGSQCSSNCSTVVINSSTPSISQKSRQTSTNSSLELGYSHTAQNSIISGETNNYNNSNSIYRKKSGKYTTDNNVVVVGNLTVDEGTDIASETSGVYTLRSSAIQDESIAELYSPTSGTNVSVAASDVCTLSSVQSTTDEASVTSGFYTIHSGLRSESDVYTENPNQHDEDDDHEPIYSVCKGDDDENITRSVVDINNGTIDQNDNGVRSRSNSILSAGSFRGDGSDPSGVGPLLSADELSDLIVGRYPPRKTISTSMDSDCDYVTMPPPPAPPPRIDSNDILTPPPYPSSFNYTMRNSSRINIPSTKDREPPPPPPPYNAPRIDFIPLPPRRSDPPPPPPPYTSSSRERIQIPPPTPPRNDAITPREPPPPPPYPSVSSIVCQEAISKLYPTTGEDFSSPKVNNNYNSLGRNVCQKSVISLLNTTKINSSTSATTAPVAMTNDTIIPVPKPPPRIQPPTYPGDKMKPTPVHAPVAALVVGPNNYLDVHASRGTPVLLPYLAPPTSHSRQPPPPPPSSTSLATVYTSQVSKSQIEQYRQQLYSDVDYVMFPLKDPAVSKQDYIDAKQGSLMSGMAGYPPPPPYPAFNNNSNSNNNNKSSVVYRSTPYLPGSSFSSSSKYASNFNLSDTSSNYLINGNLSSHYAASTSSLYSGATCSSSVGSQSLRREPIPVPINNNNFSNFSRTRSDENILKCYESSINNNNNNNSNSNKLQPLPQQIKHRRLPPPPPPPPYEIQSLAKSQPLPSSSSSQIPGLETNGDGVETEDGGKDNGMLDIRTLREKSRNLDLPLISALCNDRYLLKQTKAFVLPKHPVETTNGGGGGGGGGRTSPTNKTSTLTSAATSTTTTTSPSINTNNSSSCSSNNNNSTLSRTKYPVSGLSATQISKPPRKPSTSSHRHQSSSQIKGNSYKINHSNPTKVSNNKDSSRQSHS